jgi:hypothetical protein
MQAWSLSTARQARRLFTILWRCCSKVVLVQGGTRAAWFKQHCQQRVVMAASKMRTCTDYNAPL